MSTYQEVIAKLKAKQEEIVKAETKAMEEKQALDAKVTAFIDENKGPVEAFLEAAEKLKQEYRAETKAEFGLADGEKINILDVVEAIRKVQGMA